MTVQYYIGCWNLCATLSLVGCRVVVFFFKKNGLILLGSVSLLLKTKKPCIGLVKMVITLDILNHLIYFDLILLTYAC